MPSDDSRSRERSASPARDEPKPKKPKSSSGFNWKKKTPRDEGSEARGGGSGHLERGYRDRSPRRDSFKDSGRDRDRDSDRPRRRDNDDREDRDRSPPRRREGGGDSFGPRQDRKDGAQRDDVDEKFGLPPKEKKPKKDKREKKAPQPVSSEPMIIVNVNDRLGTKAAIPCLASDSIKAFKAIVAAHIGRQPHEIMLKRQGERPFKDQLSLEDYGVSNGVQLDLELDTGD